MTDDGSATPSYDQDATTQLGKKRRGPSDSDIPTLAEPAGQSQSQRPTFSDQRYELERVLGRGGMGVVYKAYDSHLRRKVALKITQPERHDEVALERFLEEARVTSQLEHPAIIPVYDAGFTEQQDFYYTMRLVRGSTLARVIIDEEGTLWGEEARPGATWSFFKLLQVFVTVCGAVAYAHEREVLHRDLKPSNVMLGSFGEVYVVDWGLAKFLGSHVEGDDHPTTRILGSVRESTQVGAVVGTPVFMSPEQGRGETVGPASDVYALGGVLYVLLTGTTPRAGTTTEICVQLGNGVRPPPPRDIVATIPLPLESICLAALAEHAEERPSARQLAERVQAFLEGRSIDADDDEDTEFLRSYSPQEFRRPSVTVDVIVMSSDSARVYLLHRARPPFQGAWSCPGSFLQLEETLEQAALRILRDKIGLKVVPNLTQLRSYGDPHRDPRTRVITVAFLVDLPDTSLLEEIPGETAWYDPAQPDSGIQLAFDHEKIIRDALRRTSD